jgi:hypothetical protein
MLISWFSKVLLSNGSTRAATLGRIAVQDADAGALARRQSCRGSDGRRRRPGDCDTAARLLHAAVFHRDGIRSGGAVHTFSPELESATFGLNP